VRAFETRVPSAAARPIVGHVPHAATAVPAGERAALLVDDAALEGELLRLTDRHTDLLYDWIRGLGGSLFVNRVSRLVVDPERFADDAAEPMAAVGQGAVYVRTTSGAPLRTVDPAARTRLLDRWYVPYHAALAALVEATLGDFGSCLIVDAHSFASRPLPLEPDQDADRPDVCLGTDPFHTPPDLVAALRAGLQAEGFRVAVDRPFAGALVPLRWYGTDPRVRSVMLEVRRGTYMDEATGEPLSGFDDVALRLERATGQALVDAAASRPGHGPGGRGSSGAGSAAGSAADPD
jgi:N-formylglutamate deformylase